MPAEVIFWGAVLVLFYTWVGYRLVLRGLVALRCSPRVVSPCERFIPDVTVIVPVYDEEHVIAARIRNLLDQQYPADRLEVIIGSDGSTDRTVEIARAFEEQGVRVLPFKENRGRAAIHNDCSKVAWGEILVFTDADTSFDDSFLQEIVQPFADPKIGAAVGRLLYRTREGAVAEGESFYWRHELKLKELENSLGIVNNGTGACMAIRKRLFSPLTPVDDVDTATVIDIILAGYQVAYVPSAIAYDIPPRTARGEWRMRVRGTAKTVASLFRRTSLGGWCRHPVLVWSVLSHRGLRYLTAFAMVGVFAANLYLMQSTPVYRVTMLLQVLFYLSAIAGAIGEAYGRSVPLAALAYSFVVAMTGMVVGVLKAAVGRAPSAYKTTD